MWGIEYFIYVASALSGAGAIKLIPVAIKWVSERLQAAKEAKLKQAEITSTYELEDRKLDLIETESSIKVFDKALALLQDDNKNLRVENTALRVENAAFRRENESLKITQLLSEPVLKRVHRRAASLFSQIEILLNLCSQNGDCKLIHEQANRVKFAFDSLDEEIPKKHEQEKHIY